MLGWSGAVLACRSAHVEGRPGVPADNEASVSCSGLVFWRSIRTFLEEKDQLAVCVSCCMQGGLTYIAAVRL